MKKLIIFSLCLASLFSCGDPEPTLDNWVGTYIATDTMTFLQPNGMPPQYVYIKDTFYVEKVDNSNLRLKGFFDCKEVYAKTENLKTFSITGSLNNCFYFYLYQGNLLDNGNAFQFSVRDAIEESSSKFKVSGKAIKQK